MPVRPEHREVPGVADAPAMLPLVSVSKPSLDLQAKTNRKRGSRFALVLPCPPVTHRSYPTHAGLLAEYAPQRLRIAPSARCE